MFKMLGLIHSHYRARREKMLAQFRPQTASGRGGAVSKTHPHKKLESREYILLYNGHSYEIDHMIGALGQAVSLPQILLPACLL